MAITLKALVLLLGAVGGSVSMQRLNGESAFIGVASNADHFPGGHSLAELKSIKETFCGLNAVYMVLCQQGHTPEYDALRSMVKIGPRGSSIVSLRDALQSFDCNARVCHSDVSSLHRLATPFIAHVTLQERWYDARDLALPAHYYVIVGWDDAGVWVVDPTNAEHRHISTRRFGEIFTGYVLAVEKRNATYWDTLPGVIMICAFIWLPLLLWPAFRSRAFGSFRMRLCAGRFGYGPFLLSICALQALAVPAFFTPRVEAASEKAETSISLWRTPSHDAVNCLYLLLRSHGKQCDYEKVKSALRQGQTRHSLKAIRDAAASLGLKTSVCRPSPLSLEKMNLPAVVHLEMQGVAEGEFVVLVGWESDQLSFIPGARATVETLPTNDLYRAWSGYALIVDSVPINRGRLAAAFAAGCAVVALTAVFPLKACGRSSKTANTMPVRID